MWMKKSKSLTHYGWYLLQHSDEVPCYTGAAEDHSCRCKWSHVKWPKQEATFLGMCSFAIPSSKR